MSAIFRHGLEEAIKKLDSPERVQRHDPEKIYDHIDVSRCLTVADLGCGTGFFSIPAAKIVVNGGGAIYCVDNLPPMLQVLRNKVHSTNVTNLHIIQSDVQITPFEDGKIDLAIMANIFYDIPKEKMLSEIRRIMSTSGRLLIIEWKKTKSAEPGPPMELRLSQEDATNYLLENDYEILDVFDASPTHYCISSRPKSTFKRTH